MFFSFLCPGFGQDIYTQDTWKERDTWQNVPKIMRTMGIRDGDIVADIGCHQGYMTVKFANKVGPAGKVYAVDVVRSRLVALEKLLEEQNIKNVTTILGEHSNPKLPGGTLDFAFIMDTYHEIENGLGALGHVKKALKPGGKLVILEPISKARRDWQRGRQEDHHEIDIKYVIEDLEKAGFEILTQYDPFIDRGQKKKDELWFLMATPIVDRMN